MKFIINFIGTVSQPCSLLEIRCQKHPHFHDSQVINLLCVCINSFSPGRAVNIYLIHMKASLGFVFFRLKTKYLSYSKGRLLDKKWGSFSRRNPNNINSNQNRTSRKNYLEKLSAYYSQSALLF